MGWVKGQPIPYINGHTRRGKPDYPIVDGRKQCAKCGEWKPVSEFYKRPENGPNSYRGACKACQRPMNNRNTKAYYNRHKDKTEFRNRFRRIAQHGLTQERYDELFAAQHGKCAICGLRTDDLHIDHDHACCPRKSCGRCVRGLLCPGCNTGMGKLGDCPERLRAAIAYLEAYASQ
jgi:hypothetical protein